MCCLISNTNVLENLYINIKHSPISSRLRCPIPLTVSGNQLFIKYIILKFGSHKAFQKRKKKKPFTKFILEWESCPIHFEQLVLLTGNTNFKVNFLK